MYDHDHSLVYFGKVDYGKGRSLYQRLKEHTNDHLSKRWTQFSWFGTTAIKKDNTLRQNGKQTCQGPTKAFLDQLEAVVIAISNPPTNRRNGSFKGAKEYHQVRDDVVGKSIEEMIRELHEEIMKKNGGN